MRTEREIFTLLGAFIGNDANVRAAVLNGSRVNRNAPKDFMRDYDVALYVIDLQAARAYWEDRRWVDVFGRLVIMQANNLKDGAFVFLMQFEDGVRIDLSFHALANLARNVQEDTLSVLLYDADGTAGPLPPASEKSYFVQKPGREAWDEKLNNLLWLQLYVAKALWRGEMPFAKMLYDVLLMEDLKLLLCWQVGAQRQWQVNPGYGGKWLQRYLAPEVYESFLGLYASADKDEQWNKLLCFGVLVRQVGQPLAAQLGYVYPLAYDESVAAYIRRIHKLPPDATTM